MKKRGMLADISALLFLGLLCVVCFNTINLFTHLNGDTGDFAYGLYAGMAQIIHNGEYPLWNPYLWGGMTNAGNPAAQTFYPLTHILCTVCYNTETSALSYSMLFYQTVIHIFVFASGFYILLRVLKLRRSVCLFIAILATFSGCAFQLRSWICLYSGVVYIPLLLAAYIYMVKHIEEKKIKYLCIPGGVLGITGLASVTHGALFNILVFVIMYLCYAWTYRKDCKKVWALTWKSLFSGFLGIGVMAVSLLPVAEFLMNSYRSTDAEEVIQGLQRMSYESFSQHTLGTVDFQSITGYNGWFAIGMILLLLFIRGLFCRRKTPEFWCGLSILVVSILYCFGVVINKIVYYIPFFNSIREPYLYSVLFVIGIAIVAAYGLDELLGNMLSPEKDERVKEGGWVVCEGILCIVMLLPISFTWGKLLVVLGFIFVVTVSLRCKSKKIYACSLIVLALICIHEYYCFIHSVPQRTDSRNEMITRVEQVNTNVYTLLQNDLPTQEDSYRVLQWTTQGNVYPSNIWSVWGINETIGYINPIYSKAMNIHINWNIQDRATLQNIKYIMCTAKESDDFVDWLKNCGFELKVKQKNIFPQYEYCESNEVLVFENKTRLGNAWFVERAIPYSNETDITELNNIINSPEFDAVNMALLNVDTYKGNIKENYAQGETAFIEQQEYNANSVKLRINATSEALIATSEVMVPGWKVYIDGKKAAIIEVNTFFRGVIVEEGEHEIVFRYLPFSVGLGAAITISSGFFILFGVLQIVIPKKENKQKRQFLTKQKGEHL